MKCLLLDIATQLQLYQAANHAITVHLHKACSIRPDSLSHFILIQALLLVSNLYLHTEATPPCLSSYPGSLHLPKLIFLFLLVTAFSGCSWYLRVLLVSCGRSTLVPIVSIWKLKGKFLVLPMGLGRWAVDHRGVWTLPSLWPGESHTWAVCTCSNRSWINIRLFRSCRDRPLSCIICAWPTERRLGPKEREYRYWL